MLLSVKIVQKRPPRTAHPYRDLDVVDERAPRFNQGAVALTSIVALATGAWWVAGVMGAQLAVGLLLGRRYCLPCLLYFEVVQPRIGEGPIEDARAPRFANILGALFLGAATGAHLIGWSMVGWTLIAMVAVLAMVAVVTGFCLGCTMYRMLARARGIHPKSHDRIDLEDLAIRAEGQIVVHFTHPLCTGCRDVEERLEAEGRQLVRVDVSRQPDLARKYNVGIVPLALSVAPDGRVLERLA